MPQIGDLETVVLEHLWTVGESDVAEVHRAVGRSRGITPNTVGSALERLYRKKLVRREKVSHAYRYQAALSRDDFTARCILDAAGDVHSLTKSGLLAAFVDLVAEHDEASLDRLEALIERKRQEDEE